MANRKHFLNHILKLPKPGQSLKKGPDGYVIEEIEYDVYVLYKI